METKTEAWVTANIWLAVLVLSESGWQRIVTLFFASLSLVAWAAMMFREVCDEDIARRRADDDLPQPPDLP